MQTKRSADTIRHTNTDSRHDPNAEQQKPTTQLRVWSQRLAGRIDPTFDVLWHVNAPSWSETTGRLVNATDKCAHSCGVCRTRIDHALWLTASDARAVAELSVMQWLLRSHRAAGAGQGTHLVLTFSSDTPARVVTGCIDKAYLYPYAYDLRTQLHAATVAAVPWSTGMSLGALRNLSHLNIKGPLGAWLRLPGIGPTWVTCHLIRQFRMRLNNQPYHQAWQEMERVLTTCRLQPLPVSAATQARDADRHRQPGVRLLEPKSRWVFVLATGDNRPALVTAYIHKGALPPLLHAYPDSVAQWLALPAASHAAAGQPVPGIAS